jgi:hypothetical protein
MADKKKGGMFETNPYNEAPGDADSPNISGGGIYGSYEEVMSAHLSQEGADLDGSANEEIGSGIMGGPAKGEPNPFGFSPTSESFGKKD